MARGLLSFDIPLPVTAPTVESLLFIGALSIFTFVIFGSLIGGMWHEGGKIRAKTFDLPELLVSLVLCGYFVANIAASAMHSEKAAPEATLDQVLVGGALFVAMLAGVIGFLRYRGIDVIQATGLNRISIIGAVAIGLGLIAAALPLLLCASAMMQIFYRQQVEEQELVTLFREVTREANSTGIGQIFFAGAVLAPICEEFLFRGFFYVVFKRYIGATASALIVSALFAATHLNFAAFPSLFLLAICFTIAFESTGSLLVPITMHALFNAGQLAFLYHITRTAIPA